MMKPEDAIKKIQSEFPGTTGTWSENRDPEFDPSDYIIEIYGLARSDIRRFLEFLEEQDVNGSFWNLTIFHHLKSVSARLSQESECEFEFVTSDSVGIENLAWVPIDGFGPLHSNSFYSHHGIYASALTFEKLTGLDMAIGLNSFVGEISNLNVNAADFVYTSLLSKWASEMEPRINLLEEDIDDLQEAA